MLQQLRQCLIQYCTVDKSKALTVAPYTSFSTALLFSTLTPHCCVRQLGIGLLGAGCWVLGIRKARWGIEVQILCPGM